MYLCTHVHNKYIDNSVEVPFLKVGHEHSSPCLLSPPIVPPHQYTNILDMSLPDSSSITAAAHTTLLGLTVQGSILLDGCVVVVMITDKLTVGM